MFPEPPTLGSPAPETPPDSSRIRQGAGEKTLGLQKPRWIPRGGTQMQSLGLVGWKIRPGSWVSIPD